MASSLLTSTFTDLNWTTLRELLDNHPDFERIPVPWSRNGFWPVGRRPAMPRFPSFFLPVVAPAVETPAPRLDIWDFTRSPLRQAGAPVIDMQAVLNRPRGARRAPMMDLWSEWHGIALNGSIFSEQFQQHPARYVAPRLWDRMRGVMNETVALGGSMELPTEIEAWVKEELDTLRV